MEAYYAELLAALKYRVAVVGDHELRRRDSAAHLVCLQEAAARLDELVSRLPRDVDPMLNHYLEKQSFLKAIEWLAKFSK